MAWFGWSSISQAQVYTRAANRKKMAREGAKLISGTGTGTPSDPVTRSTHQPIQLSSTSLRKDHSAYLFFIQQVPWLQFGDPMQDLTFVTWTLAIEEQFYLVLPLLIFWLPRPWLVRVLWGGVLLAPAWRWLFHAWLSPLSHEFLLPGRLDELFGGVLLACYARSYCRSPIAWLLLACVPPLCDLIYGVTFVPFTFLSVAAFFCCVIVWAATRVDRPALLRPFIWPGRRCYALYLFLMVAYDICFGLGNPWAGLAALPIACAFAELSWRLIEAPLIGYAKKRFARAAPATAGAVCAA